MVSEESIVSFKKLMLENILSNWDLLYFSFLVYFPAIYSCISIQILEEEMFLDFFVKKPLCQIIEVTIYYVSQV